MKFNHAVRLKVLDGVIVGPVIRLESRPGHQDMLEDL